MTVNEALEWADKHSADEFAPLITQHEGRVMRSLAAEVRRLQEEVAHDNCHFNEVCKIYADRAEAAEAEVAALMKVYEAVKVYFLA